MTMTKSPMTLTLVTEFGAETRKFCFKYQDEEHIHSLQFAGPGCEYEVTFPQTELFVKDLITLKKFIESYLEDEKKLTRKFTPIEGGWI